MGGMYQLFPALTPDEYAALRNDIADRGVMVPALLDEQGRILDGHHRMRIAEELGVQCPVQEVTGLSEAEKLELVFSLNIARRHLSGHDRTAVIAQCRARGMSLRAIAQVVGVSHVTVKNDLDALSDLTPEVERPHEPLPPVESRRDAVKRLLANGATQRVVASELGIAASTVSSIARGEEQRMAADTPVEWTATRQVIQSLEDFAKGDARRLAASVPERNRGATAKRLRQVGRFLGAIAYELEQEARS